MVEPQVGLYRDAGHRTVQVSGTFIALYILQCFVFFSVVIFGTNHQFIDVQETRVLSFNKRKVFKELGFRTKHFFPPCDAQKVKTKNKHPPLTLKVHTVHILCLQRKKRYNYPTP